MVILTQIGVEIQRLDAQHGNTVSWRSKRQSSVARLTTEAEYITLSNACQEGLWLRRLLSDIGCEVDPTTIMCYSTNKESEVS